MPLPGETNATLVIRNVMPEHAGAYAVAVSNSGGRLTSSNATLQVFNLPGEEFQIMALRTNNSKVVEHNNLTGDDRGGIAVSSNRVFYSGDNATARFNLADLLGGVGVNRIYDGLVSNLRTETVYTFANGSTPVTSGGGVINALIELDPNTGALTSRRINLSTNIGIFGNAGIFSGYDRILLHTGARIFHISLPGGAVLDLGAMTPLPAAGCENWAFWGVAEFFDRALHLAYVGWSPSGPAILRTRVPDGTTEGISYFSHLSDMCGFTVSLSWDRWYFHHEGSSQFGGTEETVGFAEGEFRSSFPPRPAQVVVQPAGQAVLESATARFQVGVRGTRPISYQWRHNGVAITGATNSSLFFDFVTAAQAGAYSVAVSNAYGGMISANASLVMTPVTASTFQITGLFPTGSKVVDHYNLTGQDRGGIALSDSRVFVTGDDTNFTALGMTASFALEDLSGGAQLGQGFNALVSNLRSETVYTLANGTTPLGESGGTANSLIPLDGISGTLIPANRVVLSSPISLPYGSGLFSGWDRIVLHTGQRVYQISLPSGQVQLLATMGPIAANQCESWAYWGIAEFFNNSVHLVAARDSQTITRTQVPSGQTTEIGRFSSIYDMCSFSVSPFRNRWFFHHQYGSQFGGQSETVGFADAKFIFAGIAPRIASQPKSRGAIEGAGAYFSVTAAGGTAQLAYQWRFNDHALAGETNSTLLLQAVSTAQAGQYTVLITNILGAVTSQVASLTVQPLQGYSFRVTGLSTGATSLGYFGTFGGDNRSGIALSSTHLFYTAYGSTMRFLADDLSGSVPLGRVEDGLVSNLRTEQLYAIGDGTNQFLPDATLISSLTELDGSTGLPSGGVITLSRPIVMQPFVGAIFAGFDRIVIHNGTAVYNIELPSGEVTDLGIMPLPLHQQCNYGYFWGIAEYFDGAVHLVYVQDSQTIARSRVPTGLVTTLATFDNAVNTCAITFSPSRNRWYLSSVTFQNAIYVAAFADATWDQPNTLPIIAMEEAWEILEDTSLQNLPISIFDAETSPSALTVMLASLNPELIPLENITLTGAGTNWMLSATPAANGYGNAAIEISVTDAHSVSVTNRLLLTVLPVNDPPGFARGPNIMLAEDAGSQVAPGWATGIMAGPANESLQALTFSVALDNPGLFAVAPAIAANGTLTFTPLGNSHGTANVTISLIDTGGLDHGGQNSSPPQTFQIVLQSLNDAPSFNKGPDLVVLEDAPAQVRPGWATGIRPGPDNESSQTVQFILANSNPALFEAPPAIASDGTLTYKPAANAHGVAQLSVVLRDNGGSESGGRNDSVPQALVITVLSVNDVPVANSQSATVDEDQSVAITLGASDIEGDSLTYTLGSPAHGVLSGTPPAMTYTPHSNYFGADSFTFSVNDGEEESAAATVSLTVLSLNDVPTAAIIVTSPFLLETNGAHYLVIAPDNIGAAITLDASNSSDTDGNALQYLWFEDGAVQPFASGVRVTNVFEVGAHIVVLAASDGTDIGNVSVAVDVIAPAHAVEVLLLMIDEANIDRHSKRPFISSLKAAVASFDQGRMIPGQNQLQAFQNKVRAQIARNDPALAAALIQATQRILNSINVP
jgi:hypothetical protein